EAALGDRAALPMPLEMVDPEPATHFACVLNGKYNVMGKQYEDVLKTGEGAPELARNIAGMGYNNFLGMSYTFARSRRHNRRLEDLVRARPALGPWEQYYQPSGRDRFLNEAVRNRLAFRENSFTYNDTSLPRAPKMLDACARFIGMETSSMLHSPAFAGMAIYEEIYWRSLMDPQGIVEAFEQAHELAFREAYPGLTSDRAARALERYVGRPASQRDPRDLEAWHALAAFRDRAWGRFSETNAASIKAVWPASRNTTQTRVFGGKAHIDVNGKAEDVFGPLEVAMFVSYKDGGSGDYPLYSSAMADVLRVRDDLEVWTQLHTFHGAGLFDRHLVRQTFFGLSQKLDGISWFTVAHDFEDPVYTDSRNTVRDVNLRLLTPYGDWFRSLEKGYRKVGIYYSRTASYLQSKKAEKINYQCEGLWLSCYRAGFPADYLKDQHVRDGKAMEYEVIFAPGWAYEGECPQPIIEQLQRLVNAGKTLVVERSSKLPIEGVVRLDTDLDEYDDKRPLQLMKSLDYSTEIVFQRTEQTTAVVRELLGKRIEPAVVHDARLGGDWMQRGAGEVLIVPNWEYVGFTGMYKTRHTAPKVTEFAFPRRPPVCYDVLEMRRQPVEIEGEHMRLRADMRAYPGKIFLFLPAPIGGVDLAASASLQAGGTVQFRVAVRDEAGEEIDASLPVELTLRNPAGDEVRRVYRAASPVFRDAWPLPANGAPGTWTLTARELASGRVATASIAVAKGTPLRASLDEREAWVYDGGRVGAFFADAETPLVIAVEPGQEWVRPVAEQLRDQLAARGVTAEIRSVPEIVRTPGPWHREHPSIDGTRLWRGTVVTPMFLADAPVVALGRRGENRYIESLIDRGALAAPLTDAFPGPGRAVVDWTHRAFSNQYDAVLILANDEAGLRAGVSAALGAAENEGLPTHPGVLEPEADEAAALAEAAPADAPQPGSFRD
ncbi:MAG: MG2 domain-containing protein, partial [Planctomycetota bacterium]